MSREIKGKDIEYEMRRTGMAIVKDGKIIPREDLYKQNNHMPKYIEEVKQICTYHSDEGTSGYLLSPGQFRQVEELFEKTVQAERERIVGVIERQRILPEPMAEGSDVDCCMYMNAHTIDTIINLINNK